MSEERIAALEARIVELEDRAAIVALIHRYAECIRYGDLAACRALLCDDAWFELRHIDPGDASRDTLIRRMEDADNIVGARDDEAGAGTIMWPMIHAPTIVVKGDVATSTCLSETCLWPFGRCSIGEYRDTYRRTPQGWRFSSRTYRLIGDNAGRFAKESRALHQSVKV